MERCRHLCRHAAGHDARLGPGGAHRAAPLLVHGRGAPSAPPSRSAAVAFAPHTHCRCPALCCCCRSAPPSSTLCASTSCASRTRWRGWPCALAPTWPRCAATTTSPRTTPSSRAPTSSCQVRRCARCAVLLSGRASPRRGDPLPDRACRPASPHLLLFPLALACGGSTRARRSVERQRGGGAQRRLRVRRALLPRVRAAAAAARAGRGGGRRGRRGGRQAGQGSAGRPGAGRQRARRGRGAPPGCVHAALPRSCVDQPRRVVPSFAHLADDRGASRRHGAYDM